MWYEVFLSSDVMSESAWASLIQTLATLHHDFERWQLVLVCDGALIHFYLHTPLTLTALLDVPKFYFMKTNFTPAPARFATKLFYWHHPSNFHALINFFRIKKHQQVQTLQISFSKFLNNFYTTITLSTNIASYRLLNVTASKLLAMDFKNLQGFHYQKAPKFIDAHKILPFLSQSETSAILKVDTFPSSSNQTFLSLDHLDLNCHALVIGASGTGKSKFLSSLVAGAVKSKKPYKFLVIDPHASLISEIGALAHVVDFEKTIVSLFGHTASSPTLSVELSLDVLRGLLTSSWNARLERVLRHSLYLLTVADVLTFANLRRLLLELSYRNQLLKSSPNLPQSTIEFFKAEYSEIKNRNYTEAIAPIIALIDEIGMLPAFRAQDETTTTLAETISNHQVTLVSLNRSHLGHRNAKIITSLLTSQLFASVQSESWSENLICIIDEVATIANPVLENILAEGRKFGLHLVLAGQYFGAVPDTLKSAIFANVSNYFVFRVSRDDAAFFADLLNPKIPLDDSLDRKIKSFATLKNRECIARVRIGDKLQPAVKASTLDFVPQGAQGSSHVFVTSPAVSISSVPSRVSFTFSIQTHYTLLQILPSSLRPRRSSISLEKRLLKSLSSYQNHQL